MDTVFLLLFLAGMSLIAAVFVVGSRSQRRAARSSPRKPSRPNNGARKRSKQKATKRRKSRYNLDDDELFEMLFETMRGHDNKR
jgi:hypothetical protein